MKILVIILPTDLWKKLIIWLTAGLSVMILVVLIENISQSKSWFVLVYGKESNGSIDRSSCIHKRIAQHNAWVLITFYFYYKSFLVGQSKIIFHFNSNLKKAFGAIKCFFYFQIHPINSKFLIIKIALSSH